MHLFHASEEAKAIELSQKNSDTVGWFGFWHVAVFTIFQILMYHLMYMLPRFRLLVAYFGDCSYNLAL